MRIRALQLLPTLALVAALSLAGCAADEPAAAPTAPAEPAQPPAPSTDATDIPFTILVGAGTPAFVANFPPPGEVRGGPFDVPDNTSLVVIDAEWSCSSGPACELAIVVYDEDGEVVEAVEGMGPAHIEVGTPDSGEWSVAAWSSAQGSAVAQAEGTFRIAATHA